MHIVTIPGCSSVSHPYRRLVGVRNRLKSRPFMLSRKWWLKLPPMKLKTEMS